MARTGVRLADGAHFGPHGNNREVDLIQDSFREMEKGAAVNGALRFCDLTKMAQQGPSLLI